MTKRVPPRINRDLRRRKGIFNILKEETFILKKKYKEITKDLRIE